MLLKYIFSLINKSACLSAVTIFILGGSLLRAENSSMPFITGEKLTYQLNWNSFPVGKAVLEVRGPVMVNDTPCYQFSFTVKSNKFADAFYKVRDQIDGFVDLQINRSVLYTKKQKEGRHERDIVVNFDWETKKASYSNFGQVQDPVSLPDAAYDPLSMLYATRLLPLEVGKQITLPVTDGKRYLESKIKVLRKEEVKTALGNFKTLLLQPGLEGLRGVFKKSKNAKIHIWMSEDQRRIPVKIKSKVKIGTFRAVLVSLESEENSGKVAFKDTAKITNSRREG